MKKTTRFRIILCIIAFVCEINAFGGKPVDVFAFSMPDGTGGLKLATKDRNDRWHSIGNFYNFLSSDFGPWGSGKRMYNVRLDRDTAGKYWIIFNPVVNGEVVAISSTDNFEVWTPQEYRRSDSAFIEELPSDFIMPELLDETVEGTKVKGSILTMDSDFIKRLEGYIHYRNELSAKNEELTDQDPWRFKNLKPLTAHLTLDKKNPKPISDKFIGIFFEDINYGADGGLYAEMVQNRDFEYSSGDRKEWNATSYWNASDDLEITVDTIRPIHKNNAHYAKITTGNNRGTLTNDGFDGFALKKGEKYEFSAMARTDKKTVVEIKITDQSAKVIVEGKVAIPAGDDWTRVTTTLIAKNDCSLGKLNIVIPKNTSADLDMVSLFPEKTFNNRPNGLRADLAQTLADLQPKFMRFPGGCVTHGNGIDNIYDWKGSVGPLESRKPLRNIWGYHQTRGLGFFEYFQFCEDLNMHPLPVLSAGVPCQNSSLPSHHSHDLLTSAGQQDGIPMEEMPAYIQDILDLIEWANGPADSEWGKLRAEAGHPESFNLKYLGIGNEDLISEAFKVRFKMIKDAVNSKYPDITVVGTVGPFFEGSDYEEGWRFGRLENVPIVDEHYYVAPGWYINNRNFYDEYDRSGPKVYLGEYASHYPGRESNLECALSIALYLTDVERNGDVVEMTSYAPLLSKKGRTQWRPDLIYFDNEKINLTPDYHVQRMYGENAGTTYIPASIVLDEEGKRVSNDDITNRFGVSTVVDEKTGDTILRLANMLPVEIKINLTDYPSGDARITTLAGSPTQQDIQPREEQIRMEDSLVIPPYSFTVVRFAK